jgi:hypothetical protein
VPTYIRALRVLLVASCALPLAPLAGCQSRESDTYAVQVVPGPELDVALSTDLLVPRDIDSIRIERSLPELSAGSISTEERQLGPSDLELPTILHFSELMQPVAYRSVGIRVTTWKGGTPVVFTEAVFKMPDAGALVVPLVLEASCKGQLKMLADASFASTCPDQQTCREGRCESIDRRAEGATTEGAAGAPSESERGFAGDPSP